MSLRVSIGVFVEYPRGTTMLALLLVIMGIVSACGLVPLSPNRPYFPAHKWVLAALCWVGAVLLGYCAAVGLKTGQKRGPKE